MDNTAKSTDNMKIDIEKIISEIQKIRNDIESIRISTNKIVNIHITR